MLREPKLGITLTKLGDVRGNAIEPVRIREALDPVDFALARLADAVEFARAAKLEIEASDVISGAHAGERLEAPGCGVGERFGAKEHATRTERGATDAAAQLVDLGQAEKLGAVYHHQRR